MFTSASPAIFGQSEAEQVEFDTVRSALAKIVPRDRITQAVEDTDRVALENNTLPQALPAFDSGAVERTHRLNRVILVLKASDAQQKALDMLTEEQQNPRSSLYHHWLTPQIYADHFGVSANDIEQVVEWLQRYGLQIDEVAISRRSLIFSGTAEQVQAALQTAIHVYTMAGQKHLANASDPMIPAALVPVIGGVASLHDYFSAPQHSSIKVQSESNSAATHYLSPADFAAVYNVNTLYHQAYNGTGSTIAVAGRADISLADVRKFRSEFGLAPMDPIVVTDGADPGSGAVNDVHEATLDIEWAGAVANRANVKYVAAASTAVSDGIFLSAQYIVNHNLAAVMSLSYGLCEASLGAGGNSFFRALWQQAVAQGISVVVSSGDSGAAGCDLANAVKGTHGRGINGICSTPYSTCVGGTGLSEGSNVGLYWNNTNTGSGGSAIGYIPETAWNESGAGGLYSTGGGVSSVYGKPTWQSGLGVPQDGRRDVPDVALTAAKHDAYLVQVNGAMYGFSGTSAASPAFAGLLALVSQKTQTRLGNVNSELYKLAGAQQTRGGAAIFHDITSGNNTVPGIAGFVANAGYDRVTGLGSIDAERLVDAWGNGSRIANRHSHIDGRFQ